MSEFKFTNNWFSPLLQSVWNIVLPQVGPSKFLEIGSFEGQSITWIINKFAKMRDLEVHCIDTWGGCNDNAHMELDFKAVEERFKVNIETAIKSNPYKTDLHIHKGPSDIELAKLFLNDYDEYFDCIYVDAGHKASECLSDMVLAWKLLKPKGLMMIDDYIFAVKQRPRWDVPKTAIDAFCNIYVDQIELVNAPNNQVYFIKQAFKYEHKEL